MSDDLLAKAKAYKTSDEYAGFLILRLVELIEKLARERNEAVKEAK